jgi:hypothetical protein
MNLQGLADPPLPRALLKVGQYRYPRFELQEI